MTNLERQPSEFELDKSRAISDGELLSGGAELVPGKNGSRLEISQDQMIDLSREQKPANREQGSSESGKFLEWVQTHPWQFLSFIQAEYGSIGEFQKAAEAFSKQQIIEMGNQDEEGDSSLAA